MEMRYWQHRVKHEDGLSILKNEKKLTIGYSQAASSKKMKEAIDCKDYKLFCLAYREVYDGKIERSKNYLWHFVVEMQKGDVVVVPCKEGFYICRITSNVRRCNREELDLGWECDIEFLTRLKTPRKSYASQKLLGSMRGHQSTLCIDHLKEDVDLVLRPR